MLLALFTCAAFAPFRIPWKIDVHRTLAGNCCDQHSWAWKRQRAAQQQGSDPTPVCNFVTCCNLGIENSHNAPCIEVGSVSFWGAKACKLFMKNMDMDAKSAPPEQLTSHDLLLWELWRGTATEVIHAYDMRPFTHLSFYLPICLSSI